MKKSVLLLLGSTMTVMAWGQAARIVLNNAGATDPYFVWNPDPDAADNAGAYLVIDNPAVNAITYTGANTTGNFRSEAAQNKIRWNTGSTIGTYSINWGNQANIGFPLDVNVTAATGPGSFVFATYSYFPYLSTSGLGGAVAPANAWDNTQYMAAGNVTHMNDYATGSVNNSAHAVDRFWIVDTKEAGYAYATSPTVLMSFDYANVDIQGGNAITAATDLSAQRFNTTLNMWGDVLFIGSTWTGGAPTGNVNQVAVGGANFFKTWTLSNRLDPLPVELVDFKGGCENNSVKLTWTTATENNNDYFTVEKTTDLVTWQPLGTVPGAGNSITPVEYNFVDEQTSGLAYYRLLQTDIDGTVREHPMISASCETTNATEIVTTWDDGTNVNVLVSSTEEVIHDVTLIDMQGKTMDFKPKQTMVNGMTTISFPKEDLATGIYVFQLQNNTQLLQRRVMVY
jgi:hypothetical protein